MKITVDLPDSELCEITRITGIAKKGPAIRKLVSDALLMGMRLAKPPTAGKPSTLPKHGAIDRIFALG